MRWLAFIAAALLSGCQTIQAFAQMRISNDGVFSNMWNRYAHCRASSSLNQVWQEAQQLNRAVGLMDQTARAARLLPDTIEQALADPPPRLAVDPTSMAAAYTLLAGRAAQNMGHSDFAAELFSFVLINFAESRYAYYQKQAQMGLNQIAGNSSDQMVMVVDRRPYWRQ